MILTNERTSKKECEFRTFPFEIREIQNADTGATEMFVEGYACLFNQPYDMGCYNEVVTPDAFKSADMTDVIFNYNHRGKVMARTRNKTLELSIDGMGLFMRAKLDGTEGGREMFEVIKGGYIDRMSFAFTDKVYNFDESTDTRTISNISKVWDVSAVDFPANDKTSISARSFDEAVAEAKQKALDRAKLRKKLLIKTKL
jgi:HK97 family phage prohead protease